MLSRHLLRAKIFQALYAYNQNEQNNLEKGEKALFSQIDRLYDTYLLGLWILVMLKDYTNQYADFQEGKMLATLQGKRENRLFANNKLLISLQNQKELHLRITKRNLEGFFQTEFIHKLYVKLAQSEAYKTYLTLDEPSLADELEIVLYLHKQILVKDEDLNAIFEDYNISWESDRDLVISHVSRTIKSFVKDQIHISMLSKEWADDKYFAETLFRKAVLEASQLDKLIDKQTKNWDLERITITDTILLRLALAEMLSFPEIPIKVSLNEYIELAKQFSTPKSNTFINGILDVISKDLVAKGTLIKTGKGLIN